MKDDALIKENEKLRAELAKSEDRFDKAAEWNARYLAQLAEARDNAETDAAKLAYLYQERKKLKAQLENSNHAVVGLTVERDKAKAQLERVRKIARKEIGEAVLVREGCHCLYEADPPLRNCAFCRIDKALSRIAGEGH